MAGICLKAMLHFWGFTELESGTWGEAKGAKPSVKGRNSPLTQKQGSPLAAQALLPGQEACSPPPPLLTGGDATGTALSAAKHHFTEQNAVVRLLLRRITPTNLTHLFTVEEH